MLCAVNHRVGQVSANTQLQWLCYESLGPSTSGYQVTVCRLVSKLSAPHTLHTHFTHAPHTFHTHSTHISHTLHTHSTHISHMLHTHSTHISHTLHTYSTHISHMLHTRSTHTPHTFHTRSTHTPHTFHTRSTHISHTLHTHSTHISHTLHTHFTHAPHTFHTCSTHTPHTFHTHHANCKQLKVGWSQGMLLSIAMKVDDTHITVLGVFLSREEILEIPYRGLLAEPSARSWSSMETSIDTLC